MTPVRPGHDAAGSGSEESPWFRAADPSPQQEEPAPGAVPETPERWQPYQASGEPFWTADTYGAYGAHPAQEAPHAPYGAHPAQETPHAPYGAPPLGDTAPKQAGEPYGAPRPHARPQGYDRPGPYGPRTPHRAGPSAEDGATAPLPVIDPAASADPGAGPAGGPVPRGPEEPRPGGRAERRRAAKGRGRRRTPAPPPPAASPVGAPLSRVEARRAARAAKEGFGVIASRVMGEIFITFGAIMLLFVAYQLWWTNVQAGLEVDRAKDRIAEDWAKGDSAGKPGAFEAGEGFALLHIPKLDVVVPVAEGIDKQKVLDKGMAGHYAEGALKTAMPSDKEGNFAVAGHRNTHGEPFRYINRLSPGDPIVVETREAYYVYEMASILPQTPPSNVSVLKPVPDGSGFTGPGRYITLTTCTPEFTSTYRMIVWGRMVEERPRDKGVPDALAG
ncbi:class E sortase [Streptomyces sudanensis]|uniref:class E sortase n=1 Tax=Streptomyces sudanensis TaxID=436397 RepID=UPI0020CC08E2|nr:class E sortase [Streptomyces sudanensis]MCQ0001245.1 class E sortase [Streptomyces sudanensis]